MPSNETRPTLDSPRVGGLIDVPEDSPLTPSARSPYFHHAVTGSASTFKPAGSSSSLNSAGAISRPPSAVSQRTPSGLTRSGTGRSTSGDTFSGVATPRRPRSGSPATVKEKDVREEKGSGREREGREGGKSARGPTGPLPTHRIRNTPHLPHAKDVELAPATLMHWSRAPMYGAMPTHGTRAHSVTLIDSVAWLFGGCDERGCWRDVFCFNTGAFRHFVPARSPRRGRTSDHCLRCDESGSGPTMHLGLTGPDPSKQCADAIHRNHAMDAS